jgi:hypothetical protein
MGRIRCEHLPELATRIAGQPPVQAMDLADVLLVDVEVVRFLGSAERKGVRLSRCPPFIREWILREQEHASE